MDYRDCTSQKHNAHGPETVRIHYRWHPLFGQDFRLERRARFPRGEYVFCKLPDGTIAGLPAWMTEAVACIGLDEGTAMPSAGALSELRSLLDSLASRGGASLERAVAVIACPESLGLHLPFAVPSESMPRRL